MLRGIHTVAKMSAFFQGGKELCSRLLQVPDVVKGQFVGVMIQNDDFFACASEVPNYVQMHMT